MEKDVKPEPRSFCLESCKSEGFPRLPCTCPHPEHYHYHSIIIPVHYHYLHCSHPAHTLSIIIIIIIPHLPHYHSSCCSSILCWSKLLGQLLGGYDSTGASRQRENVKTQNKLLMMMIASEIVFGTAHINFLSFLTCLYAASTDEGFVQLEESSKSRRPQFFLFTDRSVQYCHVTNMSKAQNLHKAVVYLAFISSNNGVDHLFQDWGVPGDGGFGVGNLLLFDMQTTKYQKW